ncbi:L,D-transpeptidase family protein [Pseudomonas helleri]|uniref:L,D-transpeptidase family protein n=1 Tax=Pseudomonas helleri TaxID=1608996 RepID=UPI0037CB36BB
MLSRLPAVTRYLSVAALCIAGPVSALEFLLPPPGEDVVGQVQVIKAQYEDSFADLGEKYELGYSEMIAANPGVDAWLPVKRKGEETDVVLPTQFVLPPGKREGIVINLAEYRLYYFPKDRDVVYTFPLGIGREGWGSPVGTTKITAKTPNPTWTPPASIKAEHAANGDPLPNVVPAGPDNPLGPFKFTLGMPGYLIHGSNAKFGIGTGTSHGCFRMFNQNVLQMASMVPVGTPVRIINEPYKIGVSGGKVYLELHQPLNVSDGSLVAVGAPSAASIEELNERYNAVMNAVLKRPELKDTIQIDRDKAWEVVRAETGVPTEVGFDISAPVEQSLDYIP